MTIPDNRQLQDYQGAIAVGGAKGFFGGLAVALPAMFYANKRFPYYHSLPPSIKALGVVTFVVPSFVISAERAGRLFQRQQWTPRQEARAESEWETLSLGQKVVDFTARHQYSVIAGCWALGITGAFATIMRDPLQSLSQKVVQARMWSQGFTIGITIAAAAVTRNRQNRRDVDEAARPVNLDHSWQNSINVRADEKRKAPQ